MRHYTKRTIALCIASFITVVGAFGEDYYKNSLVSLKINSGSGGYISMTAFTDKPYTFPIKTVRQDANTYILIFPETNCDIKPPNINNYENIESIGISTYPYTNNADGYTKIIVKTLGSPVLRTTTTLYMPNGQPQNYEYKIPQKPKPVQQSSYWKPIEQEEVQDTSATKQQPEKQPQKNINQPDTKNNVDASKNNVTPPQIPVNYNTSGGFAEHSTVVICVLVLLVLIAFIVSVSKDKMASVVGDNSDFDLEGEESKKTRGKKSIKKTINKLDKKYKNSKRKESYKDSYTYTSSSLSEMHSEQEKLSEQEQNDEKVKNENVVVDLDSLYQEVQQQNTDNENADQDDLADFLNEFTFDDKPEVPEEEPFNEELYQEIIHRDNVKFSHKEYDMLKQLMQVEITQEMFGKIEEYKKAEASRPKPLTKTELLENILTSYSISQNVEFSQADVNAIKQLMNVELDKDFVTDLKIDKEYINKKAEELAKKKAKPHKATEILTLNVKNMLPDLSKELKKQGNKPIVSEVKPDVVYFSEGYEVSKLSVAGELGNLSEALKSKDANQHRPSDFIPLSEPGYEYSTLLTQGALPDLADVKANPKKYEEKKTEKVKVDEKALLQSITNVTFKPFYTDVQEELNQFENFEVIDSDEVAEEEQLQQLPQPQQETQSPDFIEDDSVYEVNSDNVSIDIPEKIYTRNDRISDDTEKLMKLIETQQTQRALKQQAREEAQEFKKLLEKSKKKDDVVVKKEQPGLLEYNGETYTIIRTIDCANNSKCSLAKSDNGYSVFGFVNGKYCELKHYDSLKSTNMQLRENEKQADGSRQYLIKIGLNKFIIKLLGNNMEFIMDLC